MKKILIFQFIIVILILFSSCGRRGSLGKPAGEGDYPKQYPATEK